MTRAALPLLALLGATGALPVATTACAAGHPAATVPEAPVPQIPLRAPHVIAHRGASAHAPEHTFAAWDRALEAGADYLEQDLQLTADGVPVVIHDDTLDRTARGPADACRGRVIDHDLEEIRRCDVGSWFNAEHPDRARPEFAGLRIPTLEEVLDRYAPRGARFYVETKNPDEAPGMEAALVELLDARGLLGGDRVVVQSFSTDSLRLVRRLAPDLPLVQLFRSRESSRSIRRRLDDVATYAAGIGPSRHDVDAELLAATRERGLVVHPYTVNREADMRRLLELGVDGMFTDDPALLRHVISEE